MVWMNGRKGVGGGIISGDSPRLSQQLVYLLRDYTDDSKSLHPTSLSIQI
jgi:hypothetical protein